MNQELFNIAVGVSGALFGWWLKVMWESIKDLTAQDNILTDKVSKIEILVAGTYVKRDEFERVMNRLFTKLDHIEGKMDAKADK